MKGERRGAHVEARSHSRKILAKIKKVGNISLII